MYTDSTWCTNCRCTGLPEHSSWSVGRVEHTEAQRPKPACLEKAGWVRYDGEACRGCNARNQSGFVAITW
jgi:hypothetical protein